MAWAAREVGAKAIIFMPQDAPMAKVEPTKSYGGEARLVGVRFEDALEEALAYAEKSGATFVHPYEDERVIAGQGTIGLEIAEQVPDVGTVVIPVGGGGLSSGIALALRAVKPERCASSGSRRASAAGRSPTESRSSPSASRPARILDENLDDLIASPTRRSARRSCSCSSGRSSWSRAPARSAWRRSSQTRSAGKVRSVALLSGGNIDPTVLISVMRHGLTLAGRYLVLRTRLEDRPGELIKLLKLVAQERANVLSVEHHREGMAVPVTESEIELTLTMRDEHHCSVLGRSRAGSVSARLARSSASGIAVAEPTTPRNERS